MTVLESKTDEFIGFLETIKSKIASVDGCTHLEVLNDKKNKDIFFTYSIWQTEKHLENYRKSKLFKEVWPVAKQWFAKEPHAWTVDNLFDESYKKKRKKPIKK